MKIKFVALPLFLLLILTVILSFIYSGNIIEAATQYTLSNTTPKNKDAVH